jgi:N-acetylmuramoyl-L-alanine amidase
MKKKIAVVLSIILVFGITEKIFAVDNQEKCNSVLVDESNKINKPVICIDPGHQSKGDNRLEPVAPGSQNKKARVSSGTAGVATKKPEYIMNLEASLMLKSILEQKGYEVVMTREKHDVNISNIERAQIANAAKANMTIRIHGDSINNAGKTGSTILVPSKSSKFTSTIYEDSFNYANMLKTKLSAQGIKVNGIFERDDITGFNWSKVPVVILELGFMSNYNEDRMLNDKVYLDKMMRCVEQALNEYFNM